MLLAKDILKEELNKRKEWKKKDYPLLIKRILTELQRYLEEFNFR